MMRSLMWPGHRNPLPSWLREALHAAPTSSARANYQGLCTRGTCFTAVRSAPSVGSTLQWSIAVPTWDSPNFPHQDDNPLSGFQRFCYILSLTGRRVCIILVYSDGSASSRLKSDGAWQNITAGPTGLTGCAARSVVPRILRIRPLADESGAARHPHLRCQRWNGCSRVSSGD